MCRTVVGINLIDIIFNDWVVKMPFYLPFCNTIVAEPNKFENDRRNISISRVYVTLKKNLHFLLFRERERTHALGVVCEKEMFFVLVK